MVKGNTMNDTIQQWTRTCYPPQRQHRWFLYGGCLFWLAIVYIWLLVETARLAIWLLGVIAILAWYGAAALTHTKPRKPSPPVESWATLTAWRPGSVTFRIENNTGQGFTKEFAVTPETHTQMKGLKPGQRVHIQYASRRSTQLLAVTKPDPQLA